MASKKSKLLKSITPNALQILFLVLAVVASFFIGKLSTEVKYLKEGLDTGSQLAGAGDQPTQPAPQLEPYQPLDAERFVFPVEDDHFRGSENANIVIVEYSDYDCPFCGRFHETALQVLDEYSGEVAWIYRHFPLEQLHPDAMGKAIASECIYQQGGDDAFWAFSDSVFESGSGTAFSEDDYNQFAADLGLNASQLNSCIENEETRGRVERDLQEGSKAGVMGTPGNFIINLETQTIIPLRGAEPLENVKNVIGMVQ